MLQDRIDLSEWVIHFVHDRNLNHYPKSVNLPLPFYFDKTGKPLIHDLDEIVYEDQIAYEYTPDHPYGIGYNANAYSVLKKILLEGYIQSGWSFRNGKPTIYGSRSAVCFTEMPLYGLIAYASQRNNSSSVEAYGIALKKNEVFRSGGRPVIYGLSSVHQEAMRNDPYYGKGFRCLSSSCGIGLKEQYRYVAMNLRKDKPIDWSHEREWRWAVPNEEFEIPGLPIWIESGYQTLSQILG